MSHASNHQMPEQLTLFHPPRATPNWKELPAEIRQETLRLLAQLVCERIVRTHAGHCLEESADE